ncbi:winged helix-turn-helix domain-containing protein [Halobellus clavatus]|jgi:DNA-binding transcriptional ArsR family regulator|uniref:IclR helix-turn-helix domain-containing protein n=1 Tax=Halobellus clavatus TaxID=660517 RepID=A0A1H3ECK5_9EURY|nr:winged helix-turn-helix domain-containing protein [Halobellus clavatus]SDX76340.1 IclR helix-turn-helix domain-containing protein [Halobellus clavatus]
MSTPDSDRHSPTRAGATLPRSEALTLLANDTGVQLLRAAGRPGTACELRDRSGVPLSTVYRETSKLVEAGLLEETVRIDAENGRHTSVYERAVDSLSVSITDDGVEVRVGSARP